MVAVCCPADKEGGFVVLPKELCFTKAGVALDSVFERRDNVVLSKVKCEARKLCNTFGLEKLARSLDKANKLNLWTSLSEQSFQRSVLGKNIFPDTYKINWQF